MIGDVGNTLSLVLGIFTLVSLVASAVAFARASLAKSTIETLQSSNAALTERVGLLEKENARAHAAMGVLEAENKVLKGIVGASDAIERLAVTIGIQHDQVLDEIRALRR